MKRVAAYSFNLNISVMKVIGIYPSDSHRSLHKMYSYVLYFLAMAPATIFGILHYVFTEDITNSNYNDFIMIAMAFYAGKFLPFITHGEEFKNCIHYFDNDYFTATTNKHEGIIGACVTICRRNSQIFFVGCIVGLMGFVSQLILEDYQQLPLNVWLPNCVMETKQLYFTVYCLLVWGAVYAVLACATIDPLIGGLPHHATAQLQVLNDSLQHLDNYVNEKFALVRSTDHAFKSKTIYNEIKRCARRYQLILKFVKLYEDCFSPVMFVQFTGSGLVIGLLCFQITKMQAIDINLLIMINYLGVLFFQIFFYCYYGTMLIEQNTTLTSAIYMSQWYEYDNQSKKALIILMERAKRPMIVRAGKLFDLSLETFTMVYEILKRAYSLLALLNNY